MKKYLIILLALILLTPSLAFSGILTFKIGFFIPQAKSDLWDIEFENMNFDKNHFYNSNFAFCYEYLLTRELSFTIGVESYTKNKGGIYEGYIAYADLVYDPYYGEWLDFAFPDDYINEDYIPFHSFSVSITPIQFSLKITPMGRKGKIIPYIGGGVGVYIWYVRIRGDMLDFGDVWYYNEVTDVIHNTNPVPGEDIEIFPTFFTYAQEDSRITIGYHGFAGLMIPVAQRFSIDVEFKYNYAQGKFRTGPNASFVDFDPFDLSGYQLSLGLNYWF
jgi:opacity protein-like surface antigen